MVRGCCSPGALVLVAWPDCSSPSSLVVSLEFSLASLDDSTVVLPLGPLRAVCPTLFPQMANTGHGRRVGLGSVPCVVRITEYIQAMRQTVIETTELQESAGLEEEPRHRASRFYHRDILPCRYFVAGLCLACRVQTPPSYFCRQNWAASKELLPMGIPDSILAVLNNGEPASP